MAVAVGSVVAVEFDRTQFETDTSCYQWLKGENEYGYLIQSKNFKVKTGVGRFISNEQNRKVWGWYGQLYSPHEMKLLRPTAYVALIVANKSGYYDQIDLPPPLPETQKKIQLAEKKEAEKEFKKQLRAMKAKEKREAKKRYINLHRGGKGLMRPEPRPDYSKASGKRKADYTLAVMEEEAIKAKLRKHIARQKIEKDLAIAFAAEDEDSDGEPLSPLPMPPFTLTDRVDGIPPPMSSSQSAEVQAATDNILATANLTSGKDIVTLSK